MVSRSVFVWSSALALMLAAGACVGETPDSVATPDTDGSTPPTSDGGGGGDERAEDASCAPLTACGATCVDTKTSAENCGRCGRACGMGSSCADGKCAPITLVSNLKSPSALALGPNAAVMNVTGGLVRCGKDGCASGAPSLWSETGWTTQPGMISMSPNGADAFVLAQAPGATEVRLYRAAVDSGSQMRPTTVTTGIDFRNTFIVGIATDAREHVFATAYRNRRCFVAGFCTSPPLLKDWETPTSIALSPTHYVWTSINLPLQGVLACPRPPAGQTDYGVATDCGTVDTLAPQPSGNHTDHVTVSNAVVYWTDRPESGTTSRVLSCPLSGCNKTPKVIATEEGRIEGLAVDETGAYWTIGSAGTVRVCRNLDAGCAAAAETLATGATTPGPIALDATFAYYVDRGANPVTGALRKVAK